jgi:hypothetical protein
MRLAEILIVVAGVLVLEGLLSTFGNPSSFWPSVIYVLAYLGLRIVFLAKDGRAIDSSSRKCCRTRLRYLPSSERRFRLVEEGGSHAA